MKIIKTQADLYEVCSLLSKESVLYLDTEFYRRRTYYAKLSIIQVASNTQKYIIDVLALDDLTDFSAVLFNNNIIKIFHSPDQDFEIFYHLFGAVPINIFDTQLAAYICGFNERIGYARLCKLLLNIDIDKTLQNSNWLVRPLTDDLIAYAIKDIEFLIPLYRELKNIINNRNLWDAYKSRVAKLIDINNYKFDSNRILNKLNLDLMSEKFIYSLKYLIEFREECAQKLDIPRNFCATIQDLINICKVLPTNEEELSRSNINYCAFLKRRFKDKLFDLCRGLQEYNNHKIYRRY